MENIELRLATTSDIKQMTLIDADSFAMPWSPEAFENEMGNRLTTYMVAVKDDKVIAFTGFWKIHNEGHITRVSVGKDYRGQHIGTLLLQALIEEGNKNGVTDYTLEMRKSNQPALKLYQKLGFKLEGVRPKYYHNNMEDALVLWRRGEESS